MNVKVYASEIQDGISEKIARDNCIAILSSVSKHSVNEAVKIKVLASLNIENQPDLFWLRSILVSTGWNNNDDIFTREQLLASWKTPLNKQFNFMHDEKDIIGHTTATELLDFEGNPLTSEEIIEKNIKNFNIANTDVIYTSWSDPELNKRCDKILAEIEKNEWFVSMECLFPDFDYSLKSASGEEKYIERNELTSHMSKHLRCYGGSGVYQGYKVGRALKDIIFSGKGLVNKPANPRSLIIETQADTPVEEAEINETFNFNEETLAGEKDMSEDLTKELEMVKAQLSEAQATITTLSEFKTQAETLQNSLAQLNAQIELLSSDLASSKASLEATSKEKDQALAAWKDLQKEMKNGKRKAALIEAEVDSEDIETSLASFIDMSDEAFEKMVAMMKKKAKKAVKEDEEDEKECAEESEATLIVETEKSTASLNDIAEVTKPNLRESLATMFSNTLKTTRNK